ncbi:hypothetical protein AVEN_81295-1 [Araneus ventricosus]|uniref:Uncharacterized protein n=1 Tax=Araneus ventricosus TaxID=182803 RepID=A0A4Y2B6L3_ARAVE|nr:hypothetical protein AVEN_81295-1 [Araneus ventricosus]
MVSGIKKNHVAIPSSSASPPSLDSEISFSLLRNLSHLPYRNQRRWQSRCSSGLRVANQTVFNQFSFTIVHEMLPAVAQGFLLFECHFMCASNVFFHNEQDVARAAAVTPGKTGSSQPLWHVPPQRKTTIEAK